MSAIVSTDSFSHYGGGEIEVWAGEEISFTVRGIHYFGQVVYADDRLMEVRVIGDSGQTRTMTFPNEEVTVGEVFETETIF